MKRKNVYWRWWLTGHQNTLWPPCLPIHFSCPFHFSSSRSQRKAQVILGVRDTTTLPHAKQRTYFWQLVASIQSWFYRWVLLVIDKEFVRWAVSPSLRNKSTSRKNYCKRRNRNSMLKRCNFHQCFTSGHGHNVIERCCEWASIRRYYVNRII